MDDELKKRYGKGKEENDKISRLCIKGCDYEMQRRTKISIGRLKEELKK